ELPGRVVAVTGAVNPQEGILGEVLDPLFVAQPLAQEALNAGFIALHQQLESVLVSVGIALKELLVGKLIQTGGRVSMEHGPKGSCPVTMQAVGPWENPARTVAASERFHDRKITDKLLFVERRGSRSAGGK